MNDSETISAFQVKDDETGELLEWYGMYFWRGKWYETDEGWATREEAENDARAMLAYLNTHTPGAKTNEQ